MTYCSHEKQNNCTTRKQVKKMRCPYLSNATEKVCVKMLEAQISEALNDFDLKHFCDGNPIYCYYFRLPQLQTDQDPSQTGAVQKIPLPPATIERKHPISLKELLIKSDRTP